MRIECVPAFKMTIPLSIHLSSAIFSYGFLKEGGSALPDFLAPAPTVLPTSYSVQIGCFERHRPLMIRYYKAEIQRTLHKYLLTAVRKKRKIK